MYDIIVIGAGLAGSTLAGMLSKKYKILLIDKRNSSQDKGYNNDKCCGGLLAPDAQKMLARLGLGLPKKILTGPQMFSVKSIDFDNGLERYYQRHYINVDREKFDRWLISLISNNVNMNFNSIFKSYKKLKDCVEVKFEKENKKYKLKTKILIGADGAVSRVRKQAFKDKNLPRMYVAVQNWYYTQQKIPYYVSIFDKDITDFYSWIIQKEKYLLIGSAIQAKKQVNKRFNCLVDKLEKYGYDIGDIYKKQGTLIMRPSKSRQIKLVKGRIGLVGEAAGFISPSSAEGISYALKSAVILANCINNSKNDFGKEYIKKTGKLKRNILLKNLKVRIMYNRILRRFIMKSRILSMEGYL